MGFTLVEILVALVVSLILMGAVVSLFGFLGEAVTTAKATVEVDERIAHMRDLLQNDLRHLTVRQLATPGRPQNGAFEIGEGHQREHISLAANRVAWEDSQNSDANDVVLDERMGDVDDWLYLTLRNVEQPYIGRRGTAIITGDPGDPGSSDSGESSGGTTGGGSTTGSNNGGPMGPLDPVFIDNGANIFEYQVTGQWIPYTQLSGADDDDVGYQLDYDLCNSAGATARWRYSIIEPGDYSISATWCPRSDADLADLMGPDNYDRSTTATYVITKPSGQQIIRTVDQTQPPTADNVALMRQFQLLTSGESMIAGELLIELQSQANGAVVADAIRVQCADCSEDGPVAPGNGASDGNSTGGTTATDGSGGGAPAYAAGLTAESPLAEVLWFVTEDPSNPGRFRLHRYQLLIAPSANLGGGSPNGYFFYNDISAHNDNGVMVPNSLEDLAIRAVRRAHLPGNGVSSALDPSWFLDIEEDDTNSLVRSLGSRLDETVVLDNVVAFDVKVFDPAAPVLGVLKPGTTSGGNEEGTGGSTNSGGSDSGGSSSGDPGSGLTIIDDGDGGYAELGNWGGAPIGYGDDYRHNDGNGGGTASWTFAGLSVGEYDVFATWATRNDAATDATYNISVGGLQVETSTVNQQNAPSADETANSTPFQRIATVNVLSAGSSLVVELFDAANGRIVADAAAIKPTGNGGGGSDSGTTDGASTGGAGLDQTANVAGVARTIHLSPNDRGYLDTLPQAIANADLSDPDGPQIVGYGAFVDMFQYIPQSLNYQPNAIGAPRLQFNSAGNPTSGIVPTPLTEQEVEFPMPAIYDTWAPAYNIVANNQFDDDGQNGVDDPGEITTPPPFQAPLRAVQITIRVYEPTSKTIRTVTVQHSFDQQ
jgi:hypothetical protein